MPVDASRDSRTHGRPPSLQAAPDNRAQWRHRDQALKRTKGEISCAECFRLKARCDRKVPCSSCIKRGCQAICPNGSLPSGHGSKQVNADTERLRKKLAEMSERIRQLEDALAILQATSQQCGPHPLLREELLAVKHGLDVKESEGDAEVSEGIDDVLNAFGTLMISENGVSRFFGVTGGSESLLGADKPANVGEYDSSESMSEPPKSHEDVSKYCELSRAKIPPERTIVAIEGALPPWERATALCETYLSQACWILQPIDRGQLMDELLCSVYMRKASGHSPSLDPTLHCTSATRVHDLGLLLMVFAHGAFMDLTLPAFNADSERYHLMARELLNLQVVSENPSLSLVQALMLLATYSLHTDRKPSTEAGQCLASLAYMVGRDIGLHRDAAKWNVSEKLVQRRRQVHWQCFFLENLQCLMTGRPPLTSLRYEDCEFPDDEEGVVDEGGKVQRSYWAWLYRFSKEIVYRINDLISTTEPLKYSEILEIDRKIRECQVPPQLRIPHHGSSWEDDGPLLVLRRFMVHKISAVTMITLHGTFFAKAVKDHPEDPLKSPYGPSFLAAYSYALNYINLVRTHCEVCPAILLRTWGVCRPMFSALIIMGTVVVLAPTSRLAGSALREMNLGITYMQNFAVKSRRAHKALSMLLCLRDAALRAFTSSDRESAKSEIDYGLISWALSVFAGQTPSISTKDNSDIGQELPTPIGLPIDAPSHNVEAVADSIYNIHHEETTGRGAESNVETHDFIQAELQLQQHLSQTFQGINSHNQTYTATEEQPPIDLQDLTTFDWAMLSNEMVSTGSINPSWNVGDPSWYVEGLDPDNRHDESLQFSRPL